MPAERYFHPEFFKENQKIHLQDQENHHLIKVMRTQIGEMVEMINGKGQLAKAVLESIDKRSSTLIVQSVETTPQPSQKLILAQAIPKLNRLDFIIEKCTELGATEIRLFPGAKSEKKEFSKNQWERMNALMIAAMKQSGRLFLPKLSLLTPLKQWKDLEGQTLFFGDIDPNAPPFFEKWKELKSLKEAIFCIGPEAGFSDEEETHLKKLGGHGVKLHQNILRTDTAAIASITLLSYAMLFK